ncbi:translation initiation factor IF-2 [Ferruginibacter paludis]|uniref:translation initiation factor IF-2 n=1 Tax=Ferruginibacter paludis TaxID=1310417 RepID=UPI0025B4700D|nr:translation initiation factor IF-2 [Ferruginibacter paludis]MDN3658642.1 translation initiation factor IF-2 [Ferruginibacter paludis]
MSEVVTNTPRLMAAAKEFNIGTNTLIEFLESKGFGNEELKPGSKLTEQMYRVLQSEFQQDKVAKEKAQKIELSKGAGVTEPKKKRDEEDLSFKKKEVPVTAAPVVEKPAEVKPVEVAAPIPPVKEVPKEEKAPEVKPVEVSKPAAETAPAEKPVAETPVEKKTVVEDQPRAELTKIEAPELEAPRVVTKIDLDAIDSSTRPKKATKKPEEKADAPALKTETAPTAEKPADIVLPPKAVEPVKDEPIINAPAIIENIKADKLEGPKILGKIELPVDNDTRPKRDDDKRKRKRIPMERKPGAPPHQQGPGSTGNAPRPAINDQNRNRPAGSAPAGSRPGGSSGVNRPGGNFGANRPGGPGGAQGGNRFNTNRNAAAPAARAQDREIDAKEIQDKIKETQAKLSGGGGRGKSLKAKYRKAKRDELAIQRGAEGGESNKLQVTEFISVSELAGLMDVSFADIISKCMNLGIMVSINQRLEADVIELVVSEFNYEVEFIGVEDAAEMEDEEEDDDAAELKPRAPIVTIMGHVDHGKTSLLDHIRNTNVIAGEAGGITQHIGAYEVKLKDGRAITFLDTPGHEAFTAMRARGAKVTDIAVIVIAADDAVMPQTKEAISHAQAAGVPMIFAINKIDRDGANPEKIKEQLASMNILVESWGGKYQSQEISAKQGLNIDLLMEKILLEADVLELKANPAKVATGTVIEASLDKGRGYVATILVQNGTLRQGDMIVSGQNFGKVKAMYNERNQRSEIAPPSTPVLILGLNGAPQAGETFKVYADESEAREKAYQRGQILREQGMRAKKHITLDEIGRRLALGSFKELNVIIKGDVDGSVEALSDSLQKLSTEEIVVKVIHKAVGAITESDVTLANASDAIIIGFNVRPSMQAARLGEQEGIQIKLYSIIYNAIEEIRSAMEGMLEPGVEDKVLANVEIKEMYKFDKATVAGCIVLDGKISRNNRIRLVRDGIVIFTGELGSLKRYRDDVKEVTTNMECGLTIKNYANIEVGDIVEAFEEVEVKRTL